MRHHILSVDVCRLLGPVRKHQWSGIFSDFNILRVRVSIRMGCSSNITLSYDP